MLKFISRVRIEFNALEPRAASCLEFLAQCNAREARKSNPNCQIQVQRRVDETPPQIAVTFLDGVEQVFDPVKTPAHKIRETIINKSGTVEAERLFWEAGQKWPVLIPEEELKTPFKNVKVTDLGSNKKEQVTKGINDVTLQIKIKSFEKIPEETLQRFI